MPSSSAMRVTVLSGLQKAFRDGTVIGPHMAGSPDRGEVRGPANACETLQLFVSADGGALRNVRVAAGDLRDVESRGVIRAERIELKLVGYVKTTPTSYTPDRYGWMPDPLFDSRPFDLEPAESQPVFVIVHIPPDAAAGRYVGVLTVECDQARVEVPLSVTVWDFALTGETGMAVRFGFSTQERMSDLDRYYPNAKTTEPQIVRRFLEYLRNHGSGGLPYAYLLTDDKLLSVQGEGGAARYDFSRMDPFLDMVEELGFRFNIMPVRFWGDVDVMVDLNPVMEPFRSLGDRFFDAPEVDAFVLGLLQSYYDHLEARGMADRAFAYIWDEPKARHMAHLKRFSQALRKRMPKLRTLASIGVMTPEIARRIVSGEMPVDICNSHMSFYNAEAHRLLSAAGKEVWWYTSNWPSSNVSLFLDFPWFYARLLFWLTWKYRLDGVGYWMVNAWNYRTYGYGDNPPEMTWPYSEWNVNPSDLRPNGSRESPGSGDGQLVYPGTDGPIGSVRMEHVRAGVQDYEILLRLREAFDSGAADGSTRDELAETLELAETWAGSAAPDRVQRDASMLEPIRRRAGELLSRVGREG